MDACGPWFGFVRASNSRLNTGRQECSWNQGNHLHQVSWEPREEKIQEDTTSLANADAVIRGVDPQAWLCSNHKSNMLPLSCHYTLHAGVFRETVMLQIPLCVHTWRREISRPNLWHKAGLLGVQGCNACDQATFQTKQIIFFFFFFF